MNKSNSNLMPQNLPKSYLSLDRQTLTLRPHWVILDFDYVYYESLSCELKIREMNWLFSGCDFKDKKETVKESVCASVQSRSLCVWKLLQYLHDCMGVEYTHIHY